MSNATEHAVTLKVVMCTLFRATQENTFFYTTEHKSLETLVQSFHTRILFSIVWLKPNIVRTAIVFLLVFSSSILSLQAPDN